MFGKDTQCSGLAQHVDHIIPHRGDLRLFWDRTNWQGLCVGCHNRKTAQERSSKPLCREDGMPINQPGHHWED